MLGAWRARSISQPGAGCKERRLRVEQEAPVPGSFVFPDLPAGYYVVTVNTGEGWIQFTGDLGLVSQRVLVEAGQESDLGELIEAWS